MLTLLWTAGLQRVVLHSAEYLALQPSRSGKMSPSTCHPEHFPVVETDTASCFTTSAALGKDFKTSPKESYFLSYWGLGLILVWNCGLFLIQYFLNGLRLAQPACLSCLQHFSLNYQLPLHFSAVQELNSYTKKTAVLSWYLHKKVNLFMLFYLCLQKSDFWQFSLNHLALKY